MCPRMEMGNCKFGKMLMHSLSAKDELTVNLESINHEKLSLFPKIAGTFVRMPVSEKLNQ